MIKILFQIFIVNTFLISSVFSQPLVLLGDDDFDAKQKRFDSRNDFSQQTAQSALIKVVV